MARVLFQIGDFPVFNHFVASKDSDVETDEPVSWRISTSELSNASGVYVTGQFERPLMAQKNYKVSASFETGNGMTKDEKIAKLMSLGGRPGTPIIAFEFDDCEHDGLTCACQPSVSWIVALGTITNVQRKSKWIVHEESHAQDFTVMDIDIVMQTPWRRLSPWIWEFRNTPPNNPFAVNPNQSMSNTFPHPKKVAAFGKDNMFYKWADDLIRYSPDFWSVKYSAGIDGGFGVNYLTTPYRNDLIPPRETWNASPSAIYAITNLSSTGTVKIKVGYQSGLFFNEVAYQESTLDLSVLNSALLSLGFGGVQPTDIVVAGRVSPFPSFVIRDTQVIANCIPKWVFSGIYPGELYPTVNRIEFINNGVNARYAYLVEFGAY